jgi:hypothetical protein
MYCHRWAIDFSEVLPEYPQCGASGTGAEASDWTITDRKDNAMKAKLSQHYLRTLNPVEAERARIIIRNLIASRDEGKVIGRAHGKYRGEPLTIQYGTIKLGDSGQFVRMLASSATVGDTVCEAVRTGFFGGRGSQGQHEQGQDQSGQDYGGESQSQSQGAESQGQDQGQQGQGQGQGQGQSESGEGEQSESGEGDGDGSESESESQSESQSQSQSQENRAATLKAELRRLRKWVSRDTADEDDIVSYRPFAEGKKMLDAGIPVEACLHAFALTWEDAARKEANVPSYDPKRFKNGRRRKAGQSAVVNYCLALAEARVPIQLVGPAGSGKGTIAQQICDEMGLPLRRVSLTGGASLGFLLGFPTPNGYIESGFVKSFDKRGSGGGFLFDEMDAADPNMLLVVNEALANGFLDHPFTGEVIEKHPDFIPISAMNTWGTGGDADYTARERLDAATIDRWRMGRVFVDYDPKVEDAILPD